MTFYLQLPDSREIPIDTEITIGREAPAGVVLDDPMVSRSHAAVWQDGSAAYIQDLGSSNGTYVRGKRISGQVRLAPGSAIRLGNSRLTLLAREAKAAEGVKAGISAPPPAPPALPQAAPARPAAPANRSGRSGVPKWAWAACGALAAAGIVCLIALGLVLILPGLLRSVQEDGVASPEGGTSAGVFSFGEPAITGIPADRSFGADEHGVGAALSAGALPAGSTAQLRRSALGGDLQDELAPGFEILSEAYSAAVEGELDAAGTAELRFPAPSQDARLAVILDDRFGGLLEIVPADGYLTVDTHVGALGGEGRGPSETAQSARRYFVVLPRAAAGERGDPGSMAAPRPILAAQPQLRRCDLLGGRICVTDGIVYIYHSNPQADMATLAAPVSAVESLMAQYVDLGLSSARVHTGNPVHLVVGSYADPGYSSKSGNLYVTWGQLQGLAAGEAGARGVIAHELAHWVQDEEFVMASAAYSGLDYWWIEVSAENLAFLVEPGAIQDTLFTYGRLQEEGDARYALQLQPFTWSGSTNARYIQAIPVHVGLCDDPAICLLSQGSLVRAINEGANPFTQGGMQATYYTLLEDAARYLLGHPPAFANTAIPIPAGLRSGNLANEWILVHESGGMSTLERFFESQPPQVVASDELVRIQASIDRGGLYSFRVSNTGRSLGIEAAAPPGLPAYLEIQPGTPFLFTTDNGEVHAESGSRTVYIAPIHDALGHQMVRLAAYAPDAAHTLQAEVGYIDLSGDWVTDGFHVTNYTDTCGEDPSNFDLPRDIVLTFLAAYGHFSRVEGAGDEIPLSWVQDVPLQSGDESMTITASARVTMQDVQVEYAVHIPEPAQSRLFPELAATLPRTAGAGAGATAALSFTAIGLGVLGLKRARRHLILAAGIAALALGLSLAGCEMMTDFWGDISGRYTFHRLEYLSEDFSLIEDNEDLWRLSQGEGVMTLDLTTLVTSLEGEEEQRRCEANLTVATGALIKLQNAVAPEDIFRE